MFEREKEFGPQGWGIAREWKNLKPSLEGPLYELRDSNTTTHKRGISEAVSATDRPNGREEPLPEGQINVGDDEQANMDPPKQTRAGRKVRKPRRA